MRLFFCMVWNDIPNRQGIVQRAEDTCGLGATGISSNTVLFQQFAGWANVWQKKVIRWILNSEDGFDFDDSNYTTYPSGTFTGTINRDYEFDPTLKLLKLKTVGISYDGVNYQKADPIDTSDPDFWQVKASPQVDQMFSTVTPRYDAIAAGVNIYPKFTQAQVDLGAKVYVEFYRDAKTDFATTGTDSLEPGFDSAFHEVIYKGASLEYCKLYKPDLVGDLKNEIFGIRTRYANEPGIKDDIVDFYSFRVPQAKRLRPKYRNPR